MRIALCLEPDIPDAGSRSYLPSDVEHHQEFDVATSLFRALSTSKWDLIIVGWHLRDIHGRDLLNWMRATFPVFPPIVFLTAHDVPEDIVFALDRGAVDYIVWPIPVAVLRARINTIKRLIAPLDGGLTHAIYASEDSQPGVRFGPYVLSHGHHWVINGDRKISLRPKEYVLALLLMQNLGRPVTREALHMALWGSLDRFPSRALDTQVSRLRRKLQDTDDSVLDITQIRGVGYCMNSR